MSQSDRFEVDRVRRRGNPPPHHSSRGKRLRQAEEPRVANRAKRRRRRRRRRGRPRHRHGQSDEVPVGQLPRHRRVDFGRHGQFHGRDVHLRANGQESVRQVDKVAAVRFAGHRVDHRVVEAFARVAAGTHRDGPFQVEPVFERHREN